VTTPVLVADLGVNTAWGLPPQRHWNPPHRSEAPGQLKGRYVDLHSSLLFQGGCLNYYIDGKPVNLPWSGWIATEAIADLLPGHRR
jgi:hypothetical protein